MHLVSVIWLAAGLRWDLWYESDNKGSCFWIEAEVLFPSLVTWRHWWEFISKHNGKHTQKINHKHVNRCETLSCPMESVKDNPDIHPSEELCSWEAWLSGDWGFTFTFDCPWPSWMCYSCRKGSARISDAFRWLRLADLVWRIWVQFQVNAYERQLINAYGSGNSLGTCVGVSENHLTIGVLSWGINSVDIPCQIIPEALIIRGQALSIHGNCVKHVEMSIKPSGDFPSLVVKSWDLVDPGRAFIKFLLGCQQFVQGHHRHLVSNVWAPATLWWWFWGRCLTLMDI